MGLLDRGNPRATLRSLAFHAGVWAVVFAVFFLVASIRYPVMRAGWWLFLPAAVLFGAGIGALMEWQLDDGADDDAPTDGE